MAKTYRAFISYSHAEDGKLAAALHTALHRFAKPWYRLRAMRVFRDKTGLSANPALWPAIERALGQSEWLLYFASPAAAKSEWVQKELDWWLKHRSLDRLILCITAGDLNWDNTSGDFDWQKTTALPPTIRGAFREEPLWVDLREVRATTPLSARNPAFRDALLDIAAPLHGKPKDLLDGDDLREQRRLRGTATAAVLVILVLAFIAHRVDVISRERKDTVASLELASKAYLMLPSDPELSALLALAGYARRQTGVAEVALRHALAKLAGPPPARLLDAGAEIQSIALSQDGGTLAMATRDGTLATWRDDQGQLAAKLTPEVAGDAIPLAWSSRSTIAAADAAGAIYIWHDPRAPATVLPADGTGRVRRLAFNADGSQFAAGRDSGMITVQDAVSGGVTLRIPAHAGAVTALAFHRSRPVLASGGVDGLARLWDTKTGRQLAELRLGGAVTALAFNPAGSTVLSNELLAIGDTTGQLRIADLRQALEEPTAARLPWISLQAGQPIVAGEFTRNGKCLLIGTQSGALAVRQISAWQPLVQLDTGGGDLVAASGGGSTRYAALLANGKIALYDTAVCAPPNELCTLGTEVVKRKLSADERLRFIPGKRASSDEEPLPPRCEALVNKVLDGER